MKRAVGVLLLPAIFAISGCVVVPAGGEYGVAAPPPGPVVVEETVEVPVVYGEPVYYPPPITVTYIYDYYTYENVGGYVNIVFWRNGRRYHHEPWYDHGRRMRVEHVHEWQRSHRIPYREFEHHREYLERKHHISHPDNYYGIKPGRPGRDFDRRRDWDRTHQPRRDINDRPPLQQRPYPRPGTDQPPPYGSQQGQGQQQRPQRQRGADQPPPYQLQQKPQGSGQQQFQQRQQRLQMQRNQGQQGQGPQFKQRQQRMQMQQGSDQQQRRQIQRQQGQDGAGQQPRSPSKPPYDRDQQKN